MSRAVRRAVAGRASRPPGAGCVLTNRHSQRFGSGPGDARAVEVVLDPHRVGERDAGAVAGRLRDRRSRAPRRPAAPRSACSASTRRAVDRGRAASDRAPRSRTAARCRRSCRRRAREVGAAAAQAAAGERRDRRDQRSGSRSPPAARPGRRRRGRRRRSAAAASATPSASVSATNAGHSQAPRIRQRMRVSQTDSLLPLHRFKVPLGAPGGDPARAPSEGERGRRIPEAPNQKGNTPHGDRSCSVRDLAGGPAGRIGAPDHGRPGRTAARDADDARHRGARDDALPPGQGPRLLLRRLRPGGRLGRPRVGDGRRGPPLHPAPRPRRARHPRRARPSGSSPSTWAARAASPAAATATCTSATARKGCVGMVSMLPDMMLVATGLAMAFKLRGEAARRDDVVRRRLDLARRLPRGDELGRRPAAAGHLHPREQPVRVLDAGRPAVRGRPRRARGGLRLPRRDRSTATTARRCSRSPARRASARSPARARR